MKRAISIVVIFSLFAAILNAQNVEVPNSSIQVRTGNGMTYWTMPGKPVTFESSSKKVVTSFYPSRSVQVWTKKYSYWTKPKEKIEFYPDGYVKSFVPGSSVQVWTKGHSYWTKPNERIEFYPDGYVKSFVPGSSVQVWTKGFSYWTKPNERIEFYPDGNVKSFVPSNSVQVKLSNGSLMWKPAGNRINLSQDGIVL